MKNKWHVALATTCVYWTAVAIIFGLSYLLINMLGGTSVKEVATIKAMAVTGFVLFGDDVIRMVAFKADHWSKIGLLIGVLFGGALAILPGGLFETIDKWEAIGAAIMPLLTITAMFKYVTTSFRKNKANQKVDTLIVA